jgi:hypothetical protein
MLFRSNQRVAAAMLILVASGMALLLLFDPNSHASIFPPCLFHTLSGLYCAGCGVTRALHALLHGDLHLAIKMNPLLVISAPALALIVVSAIAPFPVALHGVTRFLNNGRLWATLVIAFTILRNVPSMPFQWLAPG